MKIFIYFFVGVLTNSESYGKMMHDAFKNILKTLGTLERGGQ